MSEHVPELYVVDEHGYRSYAGHTYRKWREVRDVLISAPVFLIGINLFYVNPYINGFIVLTFAVALYQAFSFWPVVKKLDRERAYRALDLEEKTKLEESRAALPRQEPHGPASSAGII